MSFDTAEKVGVVLSLSQLPVSSWGLCSASSALTCFDPLPTHISNLTEPRWSDRLYLHRSELVPKGAFSAVSNSKLSEVKSQFNQQERFQELGFLHCPP